MVWEYTRSIYINKWILFGAIEVYSKDSNRIVQDLSVINSYQEGEKALKEY